MADENIRMSDNLGADTQKPTTIHAESIEVLKDEQYQGARDKAAQVLKEAGHSVIVTPEENKRILRKIDLAILPILLSVYCLQSLDKTSLSYASVFGLIDDAHLVGQEYSWTSAIVYVAQLVWQPVIAYFLVKFPIGKFCATMVLCWGAVVCGMAAANSFGSLMATRFLLGSFEASVAPTFIAIVQMWYRRGEQTNRNAAWYSMLGVVNILGSLLSYGLAHIHSKLLYPFQIIFLFCGLLTVVVSVFIFIFLPDSPWQARFLKGDDKLLAVERLRMNQMGISSGTWRWDHVRECLLDVKTWIWFCLLTAVSIPSGGISTFGPLIVEAFGFGNFQTILFNMPFGAVQLCATLGAAYAATRYKVKSPFLAGLCIFPIIGISILLGVEYNKQNRGKLLFGYYLSIMLLVKQKRKDILTTTAASFYPAISPMIYSWSGQNTAGDTKRKFTTGVLFVGASAGNIIGPHLYQPSDAPHYTSGLVANLAMFVFIIILSGVGALYITFLNKKHAATRARLGKSAHVVDLSMESKDNFSSQEDAGGVGEKAFEDITDLKNEDFVYVL